MKKPVNINYENEPWYKIAALIIGLTFILLIFVVVRRGFTGTVSPEKYVFLEIVFLVLLAVLAEMAVFYLKQQSAITLMILGILLSPSALRIVWSILSGLGFQMSAHSPIIFEHEELIHTFAQLGAIILLFKVGMHSKIEKIFSKTNLLVALSGVIVPFIFGYIYATLANGNFIYSLFIGAALAATSVGVTVAVLKELGVLGKRFSQIIIGAAVIDDILALLLLSLVINMAGVSEQNTSILRTLFISILFIVGAIVTGKYMLKYIDKKEMGRKRFLLSIAYMLFLAYAAEAVQLSAIVGAFLAGIILSKSRHYQSIQEKTFGLELIFTPIFFISLGLLVDIYAVAKYIWPIVLLTLVAFVSKIIGCSTMGLFARLKPRESLIIGIGMVPRGEVALIIASIGLTNGILTKDQYSVVSAMALLTAFFAPVILTKLIRSEKTKHNAVEFY
ncbi:MAG: cation:proton antiporter [archaeon]